MFIPNFVQICSASSLLTKVQSRGILCFVSCINIIVKKREVFKLIDKLNFTPKNDPPPQKKKKKKKKNIAIEISLLFHVVASKFFSYVWSYHYDNFIKKKKEKVAEVM